MKRLYPCPGEAHRSAHAEGCALCAPAWGEVTAVRWCMLMLDAVPGKTCRDRARELAVRYPEAVLDAQENLGGWPVDDPRIRALQAVRP